MFGSFWNARRNQGDHYQHPSVSESDCISPLYGFLRRQEREVDRHFRRRRQTSPIPCYPRIWMAPTTSGTPRSKHFYSFAPNNLWNVLVERSPPPSPMPSNVWNGLFQTSVCSSNVCNGPFQTTRSPENDCNVPFQTSGRPINVWNGPFRTFFPFGVDPVFQVRCWMGEVQASPIASLWWTRKTSSVLLPRWSLSCRHAAT